jgi:phosphatidate cytidylyltransferase
VISPDDLFVPAAQRVSLALAGGLGAIAVAERHHLREMAQRVLFVRWRTWAITAPIFGLAVMWSTWGAVAFVGAASLQGSREYARLVDLPRQHRVGLYAAGLASAPVAALSLTFWRGMPPILLLLATVVPLARQDVRRGARDLAYAALGFAYIPWLLTYFILIRERIPGGRGLLLALGTSIAISDVCAFVAGKVSGRRALAPALSPAKTVEGALGNVIGAVAGIALMGFALPPMPLLARIALPVVVAVGCVWGDLFESLLKRQFGAKDTGTWLPGFGGLLDRIDSMLIVLPMAYTLMILVNR